MQIAPELTGELDRDRPMYRLARIVQLVMLLVLGLALVGRAESADAAARVALVLGNSAYTHAPALPNAVNDARAIAAALNRLGFTVLEGLDLDMERTGRIVREFGRALDGAEVGLFFYAGHGLQVSGENYLLPVDAKIERTSDLRLGTLELRTIMSELDRPDRVSLVILDACRDNPFTKSLARGLGRSVTVGSGLAPVQGGVGTLIVYATEPDNVALDGTGSHSPFTEALLKYIETPGLEVGLLTRRVREDVIRATDRRQVPWEHSSLVGSFYLAAGTAPDPLRLSPPPGQNLADHQRYWDGVQELKDPARKQQALEQYVRLYPQSAFADLARLQLDELRQGGKGATPAPAPAPRNTPAESRPGGRVPSNIPPTPPVPPDPAPSPDELAERALRLDRAKWAEIQKMLTRLGYVTGNANGRLVPQTRLAIRRFQNRHGFAVTGFLDGAQLARLQEQVAAVEAEAAAVRRNEASAAASEPVPSSPMDASVAEPAVPPGTMVHCKGLDDPVWMEFRLLTLQQCRAIGGSWSLR